jgi:YNFM family putative membrane transporter
LRSRLISPGFILILCTTVATFSTLYLPQPILPDLAQQFGVSASQVSLLIGLTLLPLAIAPILYGYILESVSARSVLLVSVAMIAGCQFLFVWADSFQAALISRLLLGMALPAAFTALMTYCATFAPKQQVRQIMGIYIACTIIGGFAGRLLSGIASAWQDTDTGFLIMGFVLTVNWLFLFSLSRDVGADFARPHPRIIFEILRQKQFLFSYLTIFFVFIVFAGISNNLPFRLREIDPQLSSAWISLTFIGYLVGIVAALSASRLVDLLGGVRHALALALAIYLLSDLLFLSHSFHIAVLNVFLLSFGMFTAHAVLSANVNHLATRNVAATNGLYIAIYYAGGSLGSWLPVMIYSSLGWSALLYSMCAVIGIAWFCSRKA